MMSSAFIYCFRYYEWAQSHGVELPELHKGAFSFFKGEEIVRCITREIVTEGSKNISECIWIWILEKSHAPKYL